MNLPVRRKFGNWHGVVISQGYFCPAPFCGCKQTYEIIQIIFSKGALPIFNEDPFGRRKIGWIGINKRVRSSRLNGFPEILVTKLGTTEQLRTFLEQGKGRISAHLIATEWDIKFTGQIGPPQAVKTVSVQINEIDGGLDSEASAFIESFPGRVIGIWVAFELTKPTMDFGWPISDLSHRVNQMTI